MIHGIADADLSRPENENAWSIAQVVAHLGDVELMTALRFRLVLAEDNPVLPRFTQNVWVERMHRSDSVTDLLDSFWMLRRQNVKLLEAVTPSELERKGEHPTRGSMTLQQFAELLADHQDGHLNQIERIKKSLRLNTGE